MDDENNNSMTNSQTMGLRIQKKIASKFSTKNVAKIFIDETTGHLLDNVQLLVRTYTDNKKFAEALINDMIKIIVKIGILTRNEQFNADELKLCADLSQNMTMFVKNLISFYEIEYSSDASFLNTSLQKIQVIIKDIIKRHLTDKTLQRVDRIFAFFIDVKFWDQILHNKLKYDPILQPMIKDAKQLLETGSF